MSETPSYVRNSIKRDVEMVSLLSRASKKIVAQKFNLSMDALDSWLHRARERKKESRWHINKLENLEKRNPRLKKIMGSASESDLDLIDDLSLLE